MGSNNIDFGFVSNQAHARLLVTVNATKTGAEIAVPQMRISKGSLLGCVSGAQHLVSGGIVVQEERRC